MTHIRKKFEKALSLNHLKQANALISKLTIEDINGENGERSLLTQCLRKNQFQWACILIEKGADVNHVFEKNYSIDREYDAPLLALLNSLSLESQDYDREFSRYEHHFIQEKIHLLKLMMDNHINLKINDIHGYPAWFYTIEMDSLDMAKLMVENGINPLERGFDGEPALNWAAYLGRMDFCKWLKNEGQLFDDCSMNHITPYQSAVSGDRVDILEWMIGEGLMLHLKSSDVYKNPFLACAGCFRPIPYKAIQFLFEKSNNDV